MLFGKVRLFFSFGWKRFDDLCILSQFLLLLFFEENLSNPIDDDVHWIYNSMRMHLMLILVHPIVEMVWCFGLCSTVLKLQNISIYSAYSMVDRHFRLEHTCKSTMQMSSVTMSQACPNSPVFLFDLLILLGRYHRAKTWYVWLEPKGYLRNDKIHFIIKCWFFFVK